jgi:hypothetical protein
MCGAGVAHVRELIPYGNQTRRCGPSVGFELLDAVFKLGREICKQDSAALFFVVPQFVHYCEY